MYANGVWSANRLGSLVSRKKTRSKLSSQLEKRAQDIENAVAICNNSYSLHESKQHLQRANRTMLNRQWNRRSQLTHQKTTGLCLLIAFFLLTSYESPAKERAFRVFDQSNGLPVSSLSGFAQDTDGFLWLGTAAGLYRFDGLEFRHWAKDKIAGWHYQIIAGPNGEVLVTCLPDNTLYRILPNQDAEVVVGPDGQPFDHIQDVAFTTDGRLWVSRLDGLFYSDDQRRWVAMPDEIRGNEQIWQLSPSLDGTLLVATTRSIWKVNPDLSYDRILTRNFVGYIGNVIAHPNGSIFFIEKHLDGGKIFEWRDGQVSLRIALKTNMHDFGIRGNTVWANGDRYLVALRPNREPEVLEAGKDIPIGGGLVVDAEESLWISDGKGLFQLPEPETEIWTRHEGLPELGAIALHKTAEGIWISTWSGLGHLERTTGDDWRASTYKLPHMGQICSDGQDIMWLYDYKNFWHRSGGTFIKHPQTIQGSIGGCDRAPDGSVWMTTSRGLWRMQAGGAMPALISHPFDDKDLGSVFEDSKGRLWLTRNEEICNAPASNILSGLRVDWTCNTIKGAREIGKPVELPDGELWAGTDMQGVWRYADRTGWQSIPASLQLISKASKLRLSHSGGVWIMGTTARIRVFPRSDLPDGWQVVEQLSNLQGIPTGEIWDLIEEPDGSLWLAAASGITHVPSRARYPKLEPPRIKLVNLLINGERVDSTAAPRIPAGRNQIELQFAALSYRDRSLLKYQYKLHPNDAWSESNGNVPLFRFYDLRSGKYSVEIRASLDGVNWSNLPARISFEVLSPWYFRWWTIAVYILFVGIALLLAHRVRVRVLLQLERQRTRIAMDLHDEIGSGLGSIGILSSVAASRTVGEEQRQQMTRRISETADELGTSLTDIVWSLRADATTLESLGLHLARRGETLFADDRTKFIAKFPDEWPAINLSLTTRRSVLLVAMESLHNAAKHSKAKNVTLQFSQFDGRKWRMQIEDDGAGLGNGASSYGSGLGLQSMIRRAEEIGAEIYFTSKNGRGTIVSLTFNPQAKERR